MHVTDYKADGGKGDSGSGVSQRVGSVHGPISYLFGSTIAGDDNVHVNIATRSQAQLVDFCYYAGVCVTKEMAMKGNGLEDQVYVRFDTVYVVPKNNMGQY